MRSTASSAYKIGKHVIRCENVEKTRTVPGTVAFLRGIEHRGHEEISRSLYFVASIFFSESHERLEW